MGFKIGKAIAGGLKGFASGGWAGAAAGALGGGLSGGGGGGGSGTSPGAPGFVPYGITTGFGTSNINAANKTATYSLDPALKAFRDRMYGGATDTLNTADPSYANAVSDYGKGLFGEATSMNLDAMTQDYFNKNLALLEPARAQESSRLNDLMFSKGTLGQGVGMSGGYVNPQQFALQMARESENSRLALGAEDRTRAIQGDTLQRAGTMYSLGQSYLSQPYDTANTLFGYGSNIEALGANSMALGMNMGSTAGNLNNEAAAFNSRINQQNYTNQMDRATANRDTWSGAIDQIGKIDWGGLFGGGGSSDMPESQGDSNYYYNMNNQA